MAIQLCKMIRFNSNKNNWWQTCLWYNSHTMTVTDHPLLYFAEDREAAAVITMTHFIINKESALLIKHNAKVKVYSGSGSTAMRMCPPPSTCNCMPQPRAQHPQPHQQNVMSTSIITYTATDRYTVPSMELCTLVQIVNTSTAWTENSSILSRWQHAATPPISMFIRESSDFPFSSTVNSTDQVAVFMLMPTWSWDPDSHLASSLKVLPLLCCYNYN